MTLRVEHGLGDRALGQDGLVERLNREVMVVLRRLRRGANEHVMMVTLVAPGSQLATVPGRILLVEVDTSHADWSAGSVILPVEHSLGDEVVVVDVGGNAFAENITVTAADPITGTATVSSDFGSARFISNGAAWRRI